MRNDDASWLLITQPDHASLAERIVTAIRTEPALDGPHREAVLLATREHDNGWLEPDAAPMVDPATGRPFDFIAGPAWVKHDLWPRGIARVAHMNMRAGALVAEHAVTVYAYRRGEPDWAPFFDPITDMRDQLLRRLGALTGAGREVFDADYRVVRLGDLLSLQFCNGWPEPKEALGYRVWTEGPRLLVSPDPFGGAEIVLQVTMRRIPARPYSDDADLHRALASAAPEVLRGTAVGATHVRQG